MMETAIEYVGTKTPPRQKHCKLSVHEYQIIRRIRQLLNNGADMIVIQKRNGKPHIRAVGKLEG